MTSATQSLLARILSCVVYLAFLLETLAALAFTLDASIPKTTMAVSAAAGAILFATAALLGWRLRLRDNLVEGKAKDWRSHRKQIGLVILFGVVVRICWLVAVPPVQTSDYLRYLNVGRSLLSQHIYTELVQGHPFRAFTPPGLPAVLAGGIQVFGDHAWTPAILNLVFYALSSALIVVIAMRLLGWQGAIASTLLFAIWPSNVALTGLAASEPLFLLLLLVSCLFLFLPPEAAFRWSPACGIAAGLATLTRPTALTFPVLWIAAILLLGVSRERIKSFLVASLLLVVTVVPWTIRNYRVLHSLVPVSTNGGDVFYRANNPLATGSWSARGERDLAPYLDNEVLWNKTAFAWGKEWVRSHPIEFAKLAFKKQFIFLGSDETGVYWAVERPYPQWSVRDAVGKAVSDFWWLGLWVLLCFGLVLHRREVLQTPQLLCLLLPFLYFAGIHAIFESQERYHIPAIPFLLILAALAFRRERLLAQGS